MSNPFKDIGDSLEAGLKNNLSNTLLNSVFGEDINRYFRDGRLSSTNFGLNNSYLQNNLPRFKFQYYVRIKFNPLLRDFTSKYFSDVDEPLLIPLVKSIDMPSMEIQTNELNQYNKKRISQNKITFKDINMTLHDVTDGKSLRFWEMYYEYYFREGLNVDGTTTGGPSGKWEGNLSRNLNNKQFQNDIVEDTFNNNFGYNIERVKNERYLIDSIEIYQVHAGRFCKAELVHPRIVTFSHDTLSFEQNQLVEMKFSIAFEDAVYHNFFTPFEGEDTAVFSRSDYREVQGQPKNAGVTMPKRDVVVPASTSGGGIFGNLQQGVGGVLNTLPHVLSQGISSAIFTGKVDFSPAVQQFGYNLGTQAVVGLTQPLSTVFSTNPKPESGYPDNGR